MVASDPRPEMRSAEPGDGVGRKRGVDATYQRFSLKYLLEILFRRKRTVILPCLLATALACGGAMLMPKTYMSSTSILLGKDDVLNPLVKWQTAISLGVSDYLVSFNKIIYSRTLLEELVNRLDLLEGDPDPLAMEKMLNSLRGAITANASGAESFGIDVKWRDPVVARDITQTVTDLFIDKSLEGGRKEATAAVDFIQAQLDRYQARLARAENRLKAYKEQNPDRMPERHNSYLSDLAGYRKNVVDAQVEMKELELRIKLLDSRLSGEAPMVVESSSFLNVSPIQQKLESLRLEYQRKKVIFKPGHPDLIATLAELESVAKIREIEKTSKVADETKEVRSPTYQEVLARLQDAQVDLEAKALEKSELERIIVELEGKAAGIPESEMALHAMEREVTINKQLFEQLRTKVEHARVSQQVELQSQENRFQILDSAKVPLRHSSPNVPLIFIGGFIGGLFTGIGLIFLFEFLNQSVVREEEMVFVFDELILATIPKMHA
jgi:succinoglycan biosynthesis transport protein ExoP